MKHKIVIDPRFEDNREGRPKVYSEVVDDNFNEELEQAMVATAETGTSVDVGDLKGHGIAAGSLLKLRTNPGQAISEMLGIRQTHDADLPEQLAMFTDFFHVEPV